MTSSSLVRPTEPGGVICLAVQRAVVRACNGSSMGRPQTYSPNLAPGTTSTPSSPALRLSQSAASCQCDGTRSKSPGAASPWLKTGSTSAAAAATATARSGILALTSRWARPKASASRIKGSNLRRLRSGASGPSSSQRTGSASTGSSALACPATSATTPTRNSATTNPLAGRSRRASPARPSAAGTPVTTTIVAEVAMAKPGGCSKTPFSGR